MRIDAFHPIIVVIPVRTFLLDTTQQLSMLRNITLNAEHRIFVGQLQS